MASSPSGAGEPRAADRDSARPRRDAAAGRTRLLFVCLGNICRSPTAEGVMRELIVGEGLEREIGLDSAGTGAWHVGSAPDERATAAAAARGIALEGSARQVTRADFDEFDLLLAMDAANLSELRRLAPDEAGRAKVRLLREFDRASAGSRDLDVPDPYYDGEDGFELRAGARAGGVRGPVVGHPRRPGAVTLPPGASVIARVAGGDINEAFHVRLADGEEAFVKTRADAAPGEYAAEAAALEWLAQPGALRTPRVLEVDDGYLALEWVAPGRLDAGGAEELGRGLAATHAAGADVFGLAGGRAGVAGVDGAGGPVGADEAGSAAGAGTAAAFGSLRLSNAPSADWPTFYAERRLLALTRIARDRGVLSEAGVGSLERVCERMAELTGPADRTGRHSLRSCPRTGQPARLHGDLWSGNVMADESGRPWLIDPSSYGGHREVDLAMLRLFGAPPQRVFEAYAEVAPLAAGWEQRVELYQLLPLLVHALLFGGSYVTAAERIAARYGAVGR